MACMPSNLKCLDISHCYFENIAYLPASLQKLIANNNRLKTIAGLPMDLVELHISKNNLHSLPKFPDRSLKIVDVSCNLIENISYVPGCVEKFDCQKNKLKQIPEHEITTKVNSKDNPIIIDNDDDVEISDVNDIFADIDHKSPIKQITHTSSNTSQHQFHDLSNHTPQNNNPLNHVAQHNTHHNTVHHNVQNHTSHGHRWDMMHNYNNTSYYGGTSSYSYGNYWSKCSKMNPNYIISNGRVVV